MSYTIKYTDANKAPIIVQDDTVDTSTDVTLFGRGDTDYGAQLQEDLLHLLEHFALPANNNNDPNTLQASNNLLEFPTEGQFWFNKTNSTLYFNNGSTWVPILRSDHISANWGVIGDGGQLPLPETPSDGVPFTYSDCAWIVAPFNYPKNVATMQCITDQNAVVTMKYTYSTDNPPVLYSGFANYLIIGMKGNQNYIWPTPTPSATYNIPSPTPTTTITPTVTPTLNASATPLPSPTPSATPSPTPSQTPSPTLTPYASPTPAPTITPTPSPNYISSVAAPSSVSGGCVYPHPYAGTCCANASGTGTITGGIGPYTVSAIYISGATASFSYTISGNSISFTFNRCANATGYGVTLDGYYKLKVTDANGGIAYSGDILVETFHNNTA